MLEKKEPLSKMWYNFSRTVMVKKKSLRKKVIWKFRLYEKPIKAELGRWQWAVTLSSSPLTCNARKSCPKLWQLIFLSLCAVISFPNSHHPPFELLYLLILECAVQLFMSLPFTKYLHLLLKVYEKHTHFSIHGIYVTIPKLHLKQK